MKIEYIKKLKALTFPLNWKDSRRCPICESKEACEIDCPINMGRDWHDEDNHGVKEIFCCGCQTKVEARLTCGAEVYPHRDDLHDLPFWRCDGCGNYVGCHHKTKNKTQPLGCIPTKEIKNARQHIHRILDPIWQSGKMKRTEVYKFISEKTKRRYHTAHIRSVEEAREVYKIITELAKS